ncbi:MAG: chemotaxis protein methyltransferase CheR [Tenuifilum sp.]|jgi:chemotaxis protein methyltransferase CheR|uniref:CheR family methyltransferase n=1 Tax=Tenuifilum sp. TaxID=2760880 RepID=UPI0024AC341D|nr:CheR family methyltransferase [Tenuifilum sp.]MDI3526248.1 chemotaxis protein methyltransferase CheR [Tenuifilum sp.]
MQIRYEIGIVDTRNVIKTLLDEYGLDFRDYALTSFKRRLEHIISLYALRDGEGLIAKLKNNKEFIDEFLYHIYPETTEMFRDPSFWRALRDEIIPELLKGSPTKPRIWIAAFDSGEELYSLAITLHELNLLDKVNIYCNILSEKNIARITSGQLDPKDMEINEANYMRFNDKGKYSNYYQAEGGNIKFNVELIKDVKFVKQNSLIEENPGATKLIIFRNQAIYYNQTLTDKIIERFSNSLVPGGFLALGVKETLNNSSLSNKFTLFNESERIYKRKSV